MNNLIEYSLDTPKSIDNILTSKILNLIQRDNQYNLMFGGDKQNKIDINYINLILGLLLITIGFYLCWNENNYVSTDGYIQNVICSSKQKMSECKINLIYTVDTIKYSKIITGNIIDKLKNPSNQKNIIPIYYQKSDPNVIRFNDINYLTIGIGIISIIVGIYTIIKSL